MNEKIRRASIAPITQPAAIGKLLKWASAHSLWYITTGAGCCADELFNALGCRYDIERFGCLFQEDPSQADLLIVTGVISQKAAPHLLALYERMRFPKYVMALGSCANCGGPYAVGENQMIISGAERILPVDVYVPGCPPRPEAILNGLIALQEKISGYERTHSTTR